MKKLIITSTLLLCWLAGTSVSNAWFVQGKAFCDSDQNGILDAQDTGLQSVLVVVTNTSGTFSNASYTAVDGFFIVGVNDFPDSYGAYIYASTIASDSIFVLPTGGVWLFNTTSNNNEITFNFLISSSTCPPPRPPMTSACWLTGGGIIRSSANGQPDHSFGGVCYPGCNPTAGNGGNWNHVAHKEKLHFMGKVIDMVNCGNVPGIPPGSSSPRTPFNFIEFAGKGKLVGISGNTANYGEVFFFVHAEDRGEPGKGVDRYYLRVYDATGVTLLLVSDDEANPTVVAPVIIAGGNLQLHVSGCGKTH